MGNGCGERYPFDFEPNGIPFRSKSKGKLSPRSYPIQFERKWNTSFLSVLLSSVCIFELQTFDEEHYELRMMLSDIFTKKGLFVNTFGSIF